MRSYAMHGKWLLGLSIIIVFIILGQIVEKKKNKYTELWRKVDQIERECLK